MRKSVKILVTGLILTILVIVSVFIINNQVTNFAKGRTYYKTRHIPHRRVGLLLGTGRVVSTGQMNLYYLYRIRATVALFKAHKIDIILISGDNSRKDYDEPSMMKTDLMAQGIPEERIHLDYAGFRTLDSMVRCKEIFGQNKVTVISQHYHNERAIYIAHKKGIDAIGFNAIDVGGSYGIKNHTREKLARVKMILDLLLNKQPKYLGEKIKI
ncbi:MAG: YdcF family protein [Prolixibacteraceae bacterium]|nr:YdcF family protein [Prolixibacteraceae bacterium]